MTPPEDRRSPGDPWKDACMYLKRAEHTARQLREHLIVRGHPPDVADAAVERAERVGLVDDRRFAECFVRSHTERSPMGIVRLRSELSRRGVPRNVAEQVLLGRDDGDLFDGLVKLVRSRYGSLEGERAIRRAAGYLRRRGFPVDLSLRVIDRALDREGW